jgi:short-subunit dehydrogenase
MEVFHAAGWRVSGIARRQDRLDALVERLNSGTDQLRAHGHLADVTDEAGMSRALAALAGPSHFDLVIANAGRGLDGELTELTSDDLSKLFEVNLGGVHRTVMAALAYLAPGARLQLVASVASFLPIPRMGSYCASKAALDSYGAALRMELHARNIAVTTVHPGTVRTEFFDAAPKQGGVWDWRPGSALPATAVARRLLKAASGRRRRRISMPWFAAVVGWLYWRLPGLVELVLRSQLAGMRQRSESSQATEAGKEIDA